MEKVAVLPVPDCACAMTSWPWIRQRLAFDIGGAQEANSPLMTGMMARCWMAEGRSKP